MPKYTILADAYLRFETEANTPEDAKQVWQTWLQHQGDLRLNDDIQITLRYPEIAVVLSENHRQERSHL